MSDKIRIGITGVGGMAQAHVAQMLENPYAEIVAICDPNPASIEKTLKGHEGKVAGVQTFEDHNTLLTQAKPDAVILSSRHSDHYPQIMSSLDAGCHVLTEKPLVNKVADAHAVMMKASESGKVVGIAYQRHTMAQFRYIRQAIASGEYGKVQAISALQQQGWKKGTTGSWRQDPAISGGGQLHDSGSHLVDIILWTTGLTADLVAANIDNRGTPVDINSALTIRFVENAVGTITVIGDSKGWYEDITIWCEKGAFYVREPMTLSIQRPDGEITKPDPSEMTSGTNVDDNFIAAIRGEEQIAAPPVCGLRTMELTEAAWESAKQGGKMVGVAHV